MKMERTRNAARSISAGMILRVYQTVVPFIMRTIMIQQMGVEYLGLNSLFSSVLHVLNLAELGVGAAMVFSMYKPIAEEDTSRICALLKLYRRYYRMIGLVIGAAGLLLMPWVPRLISGDIPPELNVYWLYFLNLGATVLTYWLFAYRNCLLQAHQRLDLASWITLTTNAVQHLLQILIIIYVKNYYFYIIAMMLCSVLNNVLTAIITRKEFPQYVPAGDLAKAEIRSINGKIRDLFSGKIGYVVHQYADTIVISAFLGLTSLAVYQNYLFIASAVISCVEIILSSITAGLGNCFVTETKEKNFKDLCKFTFLFLWLTGVCTCCFLAMYQPFMELWVGRELMLGNGMVILFAVYFLIYTFTKLLIVYKDAAGLWHQDRFRPLAAAALNLGLNLLMVKSWGLYGIILSTIVSMTVVSIPWMIKNLFSEVFDRRMFREYLWQIIRGAAAALAAAVLVVFITSQMRFTLWVTLLVSAAVAILVSNAVLFLLLRRDAQFRPAVQFVDRLTRRKLKLEKRFFRGK